MPAGIERKSSCGPASPLISQTAVFFERGFIRAHIFDRFAVLMVAAACPVSFATVTRQGARR